MEQIPASYGKHVHLSHFRANELTSKRCRCTPCNQDAHSRGKGTQYSRGAHDKYRLGGSMGGTVNPRTTADTRVTIAISKQAVPEQVGMPCVSAPRCSLGPRTFLSNHKGNLTPGRARPLGGDRLRAASGKGGRP